MSEYQLNYISQTACDALDQLVGKEWTDRKRARLNGCDKFQTLIWLNTIDDENMQVIANKLGVNQKALEITCKTLRSL